LVDMAAAYHSLIAVFLIFTLTLSISALPTSDDAPSNVIIGLYDNVQAQYNGGSSWYSGYVFALNPDGSYGIHYDDNSFAPQVNASQVKFVSKASWTVGDSVYATWTFGSSYYYPGQISAYNTVTGAYGIAFSDNTKASNENSTQIYLTTRAGMFGLGDAIAARWNGGMFFNGKISFVNKNGTFNVAFNDGSKLAGVNSSSIILIKRNTAFSVGDQISATWKGGFIWYSGTIAQVNPDGTYYIKYSDGSVWTNQAAGAIILIQKANQKENTNGISG